MHRLSSDLALKKTNQFLSCCRIWYFLPCWWMKSICHSASQCPALRAVLSIWISHPSDVLYKTEQIQFGAFQFISLLVNSSHINPLLLHSILSCSSPCLVHSPIFSLLSLLTFSIALRFFFSLERPQLHTPPPLFFRLCTGCQSYAIVVSWRKVHIVLKIQLSTTQILHM